VNGPDPRAGQHRDRRLGNQRHVNENPVALFDAVAPEDIGELADLAVKLPVGQDPLLAGFTLPDDGRLVRTRSAEMTVEAVLRGVQLASREPFGVGKFPVEDLAPFLEPMEFPWPPCPRTCRGSSPIRHEVFCIRPGLAMRACFEKDAAGLNTRFSVRWDSMVFRALGVAFLLMGTPELYRRDRPDSSHGIVPTKFSWFALWTRGS